MPTVDNKVVQMTFKNEQFERGVRESLHSLEELKKALDLDKSAESLSNLEKIAGSFDISGIAKGIDDIANRFTLVGNLGQEAFRRISSFALDQVHKVTSAITSMPQIGMGKYEQKNKSVQMIQSAMPDKSIEDIEKVLAKLNEYTDLTSYDFSTMANSIGKFVNAGVDLEVAEKVMEGIANETASAGGEISQANIAMYNFSQALAAGSVKLMDWRSIQNQNLDTKEFKEQIIETAYELGTLQKVGEKVGQTAKGTLVDFQSLPETLNEAWFTSDVMVKVFEKYADRESEVGKKGFEAAKIAITLTQALDAVKDAISTGWMTSFGYLFGNLDEAGDLFTRVSDALIGFVEQIYNTRNELLKGWHEGGEDGISGYQKVIEGLSNSWAVFSGAIEAAKTAFKSVFGELNSSGLIEASKAFADFTGKAKEFFGVWTEETPENFSFFSGSETEEIKRVGSGVLILARAFRVIFSIAKSGINVIGSVLQIVGNLFKIVQPLASGIFNVASSIGYTLSYIVDLTSATLAGKDAFGAFGTALTPVTNAFKKVGSFLSNVAEVISTIVAYLRSGIGLDGIRKVFEYTGNKPTVRKYGLLIVDVLEKMGNIAKTVGPVFKTIFNTVAKAFSAIGKILFGKIMNGLTAVSSFLANLLSNVDIADVMTKALNGIAAALKVVLGIAAGAGYGVFSLVKAIANGSIALFNFVKNSEFFQNFLKTVSEKSKPIREFFQSVWGSLSSISGKIGEFKGFGDVWTAFMTAMRGNPIGKKFVPVIQKARNLIVDFVQKIKGLVNSVKKAFSLLQQFKDPSKALNFLSLSKIKDAGVEKILGFFERIKSVFGGVKGAAGDAKTAVGGFFSNLIPNLKAFGQKLGDMIGGFFSVDTSGIQGLPQKLLARLQAFNPVIDWIKGKFSEIKDFIMDPDKLLSHVVGALKGIGEFVINIFKNVNLGTIWDTAKTALGTYIMLTFAKSLKSFSESFGVLTGAIDKDEKDGFADKLRSIAITIAIVTAAIAGLAFIPAKEAAIGVGIMAMALTVVAGAIIALNKLAPNTKGLGKGILSMALSIGAVIGAIAAAALLVKAGGDLTKPLMLVGGIMVALGVVAVAMSRLNKNKKSGSKGQAKTILAMCAGIFLIVKAVGSMAKVLKGNKGHEGRIVQSLLVVTAMLAALGVVAVKMSKYGSQAKGESTTGIASTILAMCTSLGSIVNAIGNVSRLIQKYPNDFGWAFAVVEGLMITIGAIAVLLAKYSKDLDWGVSLASAAPIVAMGFFIDMIVKSLGEAIQKVSGVDPKVIEQFLIGVGEAITAMIGTVAIFSKIGIGGLLEAAGGIVALMAAIGVGVDIVATFAADAVEKLANAMWIVGVQLSSFSDYASNIDSAKIEAAMSVMVNTVLPAIGTMVSNAATIESGMDVASNVKMFGIRLGLFQRAIKDITVDTGAAIKKLPEDIKATVDGINAIQGIDDAKDVLANLGGALKLYYDDLRLAATEGGEPPTDENGKFDINKANEAFSNLAELTLDDDTLAKIKSYATGGDNDLNNFAIGIENLGTSLKAYGENIGTLNDGQVKTANDVLDKVIDIDDHINPVGDVNFNVLNGKKQSITDFGDDVAALGGALESYSDSIAGLNVGKVIMANAVMDAVATLANKLPTTGGLWQMLAGEQKLGEFAANMNALGQGMANYANSVSGADFTNVDASTAAVQGLAGAQSILQSYGGLKSMIEGTAGLDSLGSNLVGLGKSLAQFATDSEGIKTLKDADFSRIMKAIDPIKGLAEAQSIIQKVGGWDEKLMGKVDWTVLTQGLDDQFILKLNQFNEAAKEFDANDEHMLSVIDFLERLAFIQTMSQSSQFGFSDLSEDFDGLITFIAHNLGDDGNSSMIENVKRNLENLFSAIGSEDSQANAKASVDIALNAIQTTIKDNAIDPATTWGSDLVTNFATGMQNNASVAEKAAIAIASIIRAYLHFTNPDMGPLADADTYGGDFIDTFAGGMLDNLGTVKDAVSGVASTVRDTLGETASNALSNLIDGTVQSSEQSFMGKLKAGFSQALSSVFGETENPVITPVLDLTNVDEGVNQISNKLNGSSIGVGTNLAANVASGNGTTIIQGGTFDIPDHSPEIISAIQNLGDRIVSLESQTVSIMSNLRVVMNTKALVGQIAPEMDRVLGNYANRM